jgi:hypothetical protein
VRCGLTDEIEIGQQPGQGCLKVNLSAVLGELNAAQPQHPFDVVGQRAQTAVN